MTQNIPDPIHVDIELSLDLASPDDGASNFWQVSQLAHVIGLRGSVLGLELVMKALDVGLDAVQELLLVFLDSTSHFGTDKEAVELRQNPEHLPSRLGLSEQISQPRNEAVLDPRHPLVVCRFGC